MNTSKLILSFSCGKVNFSRSILLFKRGFYMSEEIEVACLLCLSDDKSFPETFWGECLLHFKKNDDLRASPFWSFCLKGYFYGLPRFARNDGYEVTGLPRWRSQWRVKVPFGFSLSPPWISQTPSILRIAPLLEERNRRGFSSVA